MTIARLLFAAGSVAALVGGSGCLHTPFGDIKLPKTSASTATPVTPVDPDLSASQAAALSLTMAESLEKAGKDGDAIGYYEKARTTDPAVGVKAARRLAVLYDRAGEAGKAATEFRELLKARPKDADLLNDAGYSCYNRGEYGEAETYLRRAVDADKGHKRAWINLGLTLGQLGRSAESLAAFEKVVTPAEAKSNLAFVLATKGNRDEAIDYYRQALAADATLKSAQVGLAAVEKGVKPAAEPSPENVAAPAFVVPPPPAPATGE